MSVCLASTELVASPEFWVFGLAALFLSAGLGFVGGVWYGRSSVWSALSSAKKQLDKLLRLTLQTIDAAQDACQALDDFPGLQLSAAQLEQFESRRGRLTETFSRLVARQQAVLLADQQARELRSQQAFELAWVRSPEDSETLLPDRTAFEQNLDALMNQVNRLERESGMLLVKIDRFEQLAPRVGAPGAKRILRVFAGLLCRSVRDQDLICRYRTDTFGVLLPDTEQETGRRLAAVLRDTIRGHHFRAEESGPEVLVTASFGYARLLPGENPDLALSRAGDALSRSQRRGRNQLHLHDGVSVQCLAG